MSGVEAPRSPAVTTAFDPPWTQIVYNEILSVTSYMRRNSRWDLSIGPGTSQETPIMQKFANLRRVLSASPTPTVVDIGIITILDPFLDVIRSGATTGPIIGAALSALEKFLNFHLVNSELPDIGAAMAAIAETVTHCKFEATDSVSDEVVLMKILHVLRACLLNSAGIYLTDEAVCEIMVTCFSMCFQMRLSELLRRSAEHSLIIMVQTLLSRLSVINDGGSDDPIESVAGHTGLDPIVARGLDSSTHKEPTSLLPQRTASTDAASLNSHNESQESLVVDDKSSQTPAQGQSAVVPPKESVRRPYGLPAIHELIAFLVSLLNPTDRHNTDTMRSMGLSVLTVALEIGGRHIARFPSIVTLVKEDLTHHLFSLVSMKDPKNTMLLAQALRVITTLFAVMGTQLKSHLEFFIYSSLLKKLNDETRSVLPEHKELFLETLRQLVLLSPYFLVDLYINFDCEINSGNVFDDLIKYMSNAVINETGQLNYLHMLNFGVINSTIQGMAERCELKVPYVPPAGGAPSVDELGDRKNKKKQLLIGVEKFNKSPKEGLAFLSENNIVPNLDNTAALAKFLRQTPTISKKTLGEYLGAKSNEAVLREFIINFDFRGKRIDEALRLMLETFRLPGEAQQIERVVNHFAETYMATSPAFISMQDAAFVLAYSVIMLNTDQHNPNVRRRMTVEQFISNNRGINNGQDFERQYLEDIYNAIKRREIVMPAEQEGQVGEEYAWKQLLRVDKVSGPMLHCQSAAYDREMFLSLYPPVLNALSHLLELNLDNAMLQTVLATLKQLATIAAHYRFTDPFEKMITLLAKLSTLATPPIATGNSSTDRICTRFAATIRLRLVTETMFSLVRTHGSVLRENGWQQVVACIKSLYNEALLPDSLLEMEDFVGNKKKLPLAREAKPIVRKDSSSIFSTLSSYFMEPEPVFELDTSSTAFKSTLDFITECRIEDVFTESKFLQQESLDALLQVFVDASMAKSSKPEEIKFDEDPALFFLEVMVRILLQNRDRSTSLLGIFNKHLASITNLSSNTSFLLLERATVGVFRLAIRMSHNEEVLVHLFESLSLLAKLPLPTLALLAPQICNGISSLIKTASTAYLPAQWRVLLQFVPAMVEQNAAAIVSFTALDFCILSQEEAWLNPAAFADFTDALLSFVAGAALKEPTQPPAAARTVTGSASMPIAIVNATTAASNLSTSPPLAIQAMQTSTNPVVPQARTATEEELATPKSRALRSLDLLWLMFERARTQRETILRNPIGTEKKDPAQTFFQTYWLPILSGLAANSSHPLRAVRLRSLTVLQQVLMVPELDSLDSSELLLCFNEVIFPLLEDLLSPDPFQKDVKSAEEARLKASSLLAKLFLQSLSKLHVIDEFTFLWLRVLDFVNKYMHAEQSEFLAEAVAENLQNMLLVMYNWGVLVDPAHPREPLSASTSSPSTPRRRDDVWQITWDKISNFLPNLQQQLFPPLEASTSPSIHPAVTPTATIPLSVATSSQPATIATTSITLNVPATTATIPIAQTTPITLMQLVPQDAI